jgi:hypothetical protein
MDRPFLCQLSALNTHPSGASKPFALAHAQRATLHVQRATCNAQRSTCNAQRATYNVQPSTPQPSTFNAPTLNLQPSTPQPSTFNLQRPNLQPSTPQPSTFNAPTFNLQPSPPPNLQPSPFNLQPCASSVGAHCEGRRAVRIPLQQNRPLLRRGATRGRAAQARRPEIRSRRHTL